MSGIDLLAFSIPLLIFLLGAYVVRQARRSKESELAYKLRKCHIALHDAEVSLDNTVHYYKSELNRLAARLGEAPPADPPADAANRSSGRGPSGAGNDGSPADGRFRQAKNAFARLYHPDRLTGDGPEKRIRTEVFKEFWNELERIERRGP
jgi:hypothetical protein